MQFLILVELSKLKATLKASQCVRTEQQLTARMLHISSTFIDYGPHNTKMRRTYLLKTILNK